MDVSIQQFLKNDIKNKAHKIEEVKFNKWAEVIFLNFFLLNLINIFSL